jgi:hypothetical protein
MGRGAGAGGGGAGAGSGTVGILRSLFTVVDLLTVFFRVKAEREERESGGEGGGGGGCDLSPNLKAILLLVKDLLFLIFRLARKGVGLGNEARLHTNAHLRYFRTAELDASASLLKLFKTYHRYACAYAKRATRVVMKDLNLQQLQQALRSGSVGVGGGVSASMLSSTLMWNNPSMSESLSFSNSQSFSSSYSSSAPLLPSGSPPLPWGSPPLPWGSPHLHLIIFGLSFQNILG